MNNQHQQFIDGLKVGDEVAICYSHRFSYTTQVPCYEYGTIERITPKRTKFIISGKEITYLNTICPISEETNSANLKLNQLMKIRKNIDTISKISTKDIMNKDLDNINECLSEVLRLVGEEV